MQLYNCEFTDNIYGLHVHSLIINNKFIYFLIVYLHRLHYLMVVSYEFQIKEESMKINKRNGGRNHISKLKPLTGVELLIIR